MENAFAVFVLCLKLPHSLSEFLYFLSCMSHMLTVRLDFLCPLILVFDFTFFELGFPSSFPPFSYTFYHFLPVSGKSLALEDTPVSTEGEKKTQKTKRNLCTWEVCRDWIPALMLH